MSTGVNVLLCVSLVEVVAEMCELMLNVIHSLMAPWYNVDGVAFS